MKNPKILLLDGNSDMGLGAALHEAMVANGDNAEYVDFLALPNKFAYNIKRAIAKQKQKSRESLRYFYLPKKDGKALTDIILKSKPDIVLVVGYIYRFIDREVFTKLKEQLGFKFVLFDTESANLLMDAGQLQHYLNFEFALYDQILSFTKRMANYFQGLGYKNITYFPYGAKQLPQLNLPKNQDVLFVGTPCMRRLIVLEELSDFDLTVWGQRWQRYRKLISPALWPKMKAQNIWGDELNHQIQSSKIVLNINNFSWHGIESGVNMRVMETLATKSFLLMDYCEELQDIFELGKEIETFKCHEELKDKINYYVTHDEQREAIAEKGYEKFCKQYTWQKRMRALVDLIKKA